MLSPIARGRIGRHDIGVVQPGRVADLTQKALERGGPIHHVPADDLQDLVPAHEPVLGQVDRPHAPLAELADDLVVGVVGQPRGQRVGWRRCLGTRAVVQHRQTVERRDDRAGRAGLALRITQPAEKRCRTTSRPPAAGSRHSLPGVCRPIPPRHRSSVPRPCESRVSSVGWIGGGGASSRDLLVGVKCRSSIHCVSRAKLVANRAKTLATIEADGYREYPRLNARKPVMFASNRAF